jgi:hypothetical protein
VEFSLIMEDKKNKKKKKKKVWPMILMNNDEFLFLDTKHINSYRGFI